MTRKAPTRTCISCGKSADKRDLLRIVRKPDGSIVCDKDGKAPGRGAYLCRDMTCFADARKRRQLDSKLRAKLSDDDYRRLEEDFCVICASSTERSRDGE
jgi:predicted RNA-binding protein YlxR (DUF448 family)